MYRQNNQSFDSDSRRSSTNPFRRPEHNGFATNASTSSFHSNNSAFEDWVEKNRNFVDSSDDEIAQPLQRPSINTAARAGSDTNVNYNSSPSQSPARQVNLENPDIFHCATTTSAMVSGPAEPETSLNSKISRPGPVIRAPAPSPSRPCTGGVYVLHQARHVIASEPSKWNLNCQQNTIFFHQTRNNPQQQRSQQHSFQTSPALGLSHTPTPAPPTTSLPTPSRTRTETTSNNSKRKNLERTRHPVIDMSLDPATNDRNMSNNPFASAMGGEYKHHREPPAPPAVASKPVGSRASPVPPPSYEEAAGPKVSTEYPQEKESSSSRSTRPHRSQSDSARRERSHRHKSSKKSSSKKKSVPPVQMKNLDTIDKLDVSAFFGGRFHHDGPFDACSPHRNKNVKAAPVEAFPVDGPNSSMKAAPANADERLNVAFGNYEDHNMIVGRSAKDVAPPSQPAAQDDRNNVPRLNPSVVAFDAYEKATPVHGMSTAGLGSTTFLNGAPAPKGDDFLAPNNNASGLGRKKSLVQRLRKNSDDSSRRASNDSDRRDFEEDGNSNSLLRRVKSLKVGKR